MARKSRGSDGKPENPNACLDRQVKELVQAGELTGVGWMVVRLPGRQAVSAKVDDISDRVREVLLGATRPS